MQTYEVKRGMAKKTDLKTLVEIHFGSVTEQEGWFASTFGAMPMIKAKYDKDKLLVDTQNDPSIAVRVAKGDQEAAKMATETHQRWNAFLFDATGYDSKTRGKKAQEAAKKTPA